MRTSYGLLECQARLQKSMCRYQGLNLPMCSSVIQYTYIYIYLCIQTEQQKNGDDRKNVKRSRETRDNSILPLRVTLFAAYIVTFQSCIPPTFDTHLQSCLQSLDIDGMSHLQEERNGFRLGEFHKVEDCYNSQLGELVFGRGLW